MTLEITVKKWKVTPEMKRRVVQIKSEIENDRREFENTPQPCPIHNKPGKFTRYEGAYTRGYAIFKCPEGHEFQVG